MPRSPRVPGLPTPAADPIQPTPTAESTADLPNAIDIDARAIESPVLTKQGWVVPDEEHRRHVRKLAEAKKALGLDA